MKIAMIGQKGYPATVGGIEYHVQELVQHLAPQGYCFTVYARPYYTPAVSNSSGPIQVRCLPSIATKHLDAITHTLLCTADAIFRGHDIIHYHAIGPSLVAPWPRVAGIKTVATVHALDWKRTKWGRLARGALRVGEFCAMRMPHKTIVISRTLQTYLAQRYHRQAIYIPNGIRMISSSNHDFLRRVGLQPDHYILYVGRLVPEKCCLDLIQACQSLPSGFKLAIAGDSSFTDDYVRTLHQHANEHICFLGRVVGADLAALYRNAYLFVLPSQLEGMPLVMLEAMGYGTCVLASDIPENREVLYPPDGPVLGFEFQCRQVADLKQQLNYLLQHPDEVAQTAQRAAAWVRHVFSWEQIARQTAAVYQSLARCGFARPGGRCCS